MKITGTSNDDILNGTAFDDVLVGLEGNDTLYGEVGDDLLRGGDGNDGMFGGEGNDSFYGGAGFDAMFGGEGDDYFNPGNIKNGVYSEDFIDTGTGNDTVDLTGLRPLESFISLDHDSGYQTYTRSITANIDTSTGTATIDKGGINGVTTILGAQNALLTTQGSGGGMSIGGTDFNDTFNIDLGESCWISLIGNAGNDTFNIAAHNSTVRLNYSYHFATGITANLKTGYVADDGLGGHDRIIGDGVISELRSTMGNDTIGGSEGDDRFILMAGTDTLNGRGGTDTVRYDRYGVGDVTLDLRTGTATGIWRDEAFSHTLSNIENIIGSRFNDDTLRGTGQDNVFDGRGGDDVLEGRNGDDTLIGGDGDDILNGGGDDDILIGDGIPNYFRAAGVPSINVGRDILNGGSGNDILNGGELGDVLNGGAGIDTATFEDATTRVRADLTNAANNIGEAAGDTYVNIENLRGSDFSDRLTGNGFNNRIEGGDGNDILEGRQGDDTLIGGDGDDRATGGAGNDTFVFGPGADVITDFNAVSNLEKIDLSANIFIASFGDLKINHTSEVAGNLVIDDLHGSTLTLNGVVFADLDQGDFIF